MEEFKDYKYGYKVSNHGRVLNRFGVELKCSILNRGYRYFQTQKNKKKENHIIHQVIGLLFMGERPKEENGKDYVIDHIDRNKLNNHIDNLRYITHKDNLRNTDRYRDDIKEEDPKKRNNILTKLYSEKHADEIKRKNLEYYKKNRERLIENNKTYYNKNRERIKCYNAEYNEKNKEVINQKQKEYGSKIITCDVCNVSIRQSNRSKHLKTKLHQGNIKSIKHAN